MKVRPVTIVIAAAALLVGLFSVWFLTNFDRVPVERDRGYALEARNNSLLAAERLLGALGLNVEGHLLLDELPSVATTVFLPGSRRKYSEERIERLGVWVEAGGHLIVVAASADEEGSNDPLLERYGVIGYHDEDEDGAARSVDAELAGDGPILRVTFSPELQLMTTARVLAGDGERTHAVSLDVGHGRLSVLSDAAFARNREIENHDNAAFLWYLATLEPHQTMWLFRGSEVSSLWERLMSSAWQVIASAAALVLVILWGASRRFGPLLPEGELPRRRLLEHIEASGRFLWKHGQGGALVEDLRHAVLRLIEFRHPGWTSSPDLARRLAELGGYSTQVVSRALEVKAVKDENEFMQTIRIWETIRKKL